MSTITYDFSNFKCRCSAITQMLSEKQGEAPLTENQLNRIKELENKEKITENQKKELTELVVRRNKPKQIVLSDTCIGYLMKHYAWVTEQATSVTREMNIDYFKKGKLMEGEAIALLSIVDGVEYVKNDIRISNDFLTGEPDVFKGEEIYKSDIVIDTKISWDYPIFLTKINQPVCVDNKNQVQGYGDISGAHELYVADVLTDMPEPIINDYRWRLAKEMDAVTLESPDFKKAEEIMLKSMKFDRIPRHRRTFKKKIIPFTDFERQKVYDKVKICRQWLNNFNEMYIKLNK